MFRVYGNKTDGNGNTLVIEMNEGYIINSIMITYTITNSCTFSVVDSDGVSIGTVESGKAVTDLSTQKISIKNTHKTNSTVGQLRITGITITYSPE